MHAFHAMRNERGEGGSHALQAALSMEAPAKATIREILTQFTESSVLLRPERSHRPLPKQRVAAAPPARAVKPTTGEPSPAPEAKGEPRTPPTKGAPKSAPDDTANCATATKTTTLKPERGEPSPAPEAKGKPSAPKAKGRPKSAPDAKGSCTTAPMQTIFSLGRTKTLETLPKRVLSEDLQQNDRHQGVKGKLTSGPQPSGNNKTAGELSATPATAERSNSHARVLFSASDLAEPVRTILANPHNYCYVNALIQALLWIFQARPSAHSSEFGNTHALLRPLIASGTTVQLHRRKAWLRLLETWPNPQQQHDVAELLVYIKRQIRFPALEGKWEARTMQGPHHHTHQSATQVPHIMLPCKPHKTLQELVEQWAYEQDTGQVCAISKAPTFLCIQLLRFQGKRDGEVSKLSHPTPLPSKLQVPTFTEGIDTMPQAYVLHSVVYHIGCTPGSGHYRTMGMTAPNGEPQEVFFSELTRSLIRPSMCRMTKRLRRWRLQPTSKRSVGCGT